MVLGKTIAARRHHRLQELIYPACELLFSPASKQLSASLSVCTSHSSLAVTRPCADRSGASYAPAYQWTPLIFGGATPAIQEAPLVATQVRFPPVVLCYLSSTPFSKQLTFTLSWHDHKGSKKSLSNINIEIKRAISLSHLKRYSSKK